MTTPRKRHRPLIGGIVAAVAILMTSAAIVQSKTHSSWRAMTDTHKALHANWLAQPGTRAPLWGTATTGHAFPHYEQAADIINKVIEQDDSLRDLIGKSDELVAEMAGELREAWQPALAALRIGAHKSHLRIATKKVTDLPMIDFVMYRWVSNAAAFETRILRRAGEDRASVQVTLDSLSMAADVCKDGLLINQMIGVAMVAIAIEPWTDAALRELDPAASAEFATGLAKLDAQLPKSLPTDRELLYLTEQLRSPLRQDGWVAGGSWRYGFSTKWMLADAVLMTSINYSRLNNVDTEDWLARQRLSDQIAEEVAGSGNDIAAMVFPNIIQCEKSIRHSLAKVRLLRMAIDIRRGVESELLMDPLGNGVFQAEESPDAVTLKSAGSAGHEPLEFVITR